MSKETKKIDRVLHKAITDVLYANGPLTVKQIVERTQRNETEVRRHIRDAMSLREQKIGNSTAYSIPLFKSRRTIRHPSISGDTQ